MRLLLVLAIAIEALGTAQALPRAMPSPPSRYQRLGRDLDGDASAGGFYRFEWVSSSLQAGDRLARSSAPFYQHSDPDQRLTGASIAFLKQQGISHVISLNAEANSPAIRDALTKNGIAYTALPVRDFESPTLDDFKKGHRAFEQHRAGTLVWCGYGHGRTGTMVTALQVYSEQARPDPRRLLPADFSKNHVETAGQIRLLNKLQRSLQPGAFRKTAENAVKMPSAAWGKALGNNAPDAPALAPKPKPASQAKTADDKAVVASSKPGAKVPKSVGDWWAEQMAAKPSKGMAKSIGDLWADQMAAKPPKGVPKKIVVGMPGAGLANPGFNPPVGKNLVPTAKGPGNMFYSGKGRPGVFVGRTFGGRFGGPRVAGGFVGAPGVRRP
ncbi:protein-tyrosine phosphatase [Hirsutella rhossiliensis]|uniref:Protein-tyrosine phosphatase n=1 Tax=Hirsutella rhossiliensis TaxID=111463 RepID=A0A9P8SM75_9HYPO|nr:protein-tyrosine phosphatase [Hirsutella rhossiliensis]KAH0967696.1 protein-tyrosine phosphatase [Hirsutella rhossiliensis]